jgi:hypothetical protein
MAQISLAHKVIGDSVSGVDGDPEKFDAITHAETPHCVALAQICPRPV